jgi:hypothetical protein
MIPKNPLLEDVSSLNNGMESIEYLFYVTCGLDGVLSIGISSPDACDKRRPAASLALAAAAIVYF